MFHVLLNIDDSKIPFFLAVTKELTSGLEAVAKSTSSIGSNSGIQWDQILGNCNRIYPELFPAQTKSAVQRTGFPKMNESILQQSTSKVNNKQKAFRPLRQISSDVEGQVFSILFAALRLGSRFLGFLEKKFPFSPTLTVCFQSTFPGEET